MYVEEMSRSGHSLLIWVVLLLGSGCGSDLPGSSAGGASAGGASAATGGSNGAGGGAGQSGGTGRPGAAAAGGPPTADCEGSTPPSVGMMLWLRAGQGFVLEGERVVEWEDAAGGEPAKQADPNRAPRWVANALQGKPALRFESSGGDAETLERSLDIHQHTGNTALLVSASPELVRPGVEWCERDEEVGCSATYNPVIYSHGPADWQGFLLSPRQEVIGYRYGSEKKEYCFDTLGDPDPCVMFYRQGSLSTAFSLTSLRFDAGHIELYVAGRKVYERQALSEQILHQGNLLEIGGTNHWRSDAPSLVAEVLLYDRALNDDELQAAHAYFKCRFFPDM